MLEQPTAPAEDSGAPITWPWLRATPPFRAGSPAITIGGHLHLEIRGDGKVFLEGKTLDAVKTRGQFRRLWDLLTGSSAQF